MTQKAQTTAGFLLRSVNYAESDRILTLFTESLGKVSAYARGARKSQKRFGGALEPFALIELTLTPGRSREMWRLEEASPVTVYEDVVRDLERLALASRLLLLVRDSLPALSPDPELFAFLRELLPALSRAEKPALPRVAIVAMLRLLSHLGMAIGLSRCARCGRPVPEKKPVLFHPGGGGVVCTPCGGGPLRLAAGSVAAFQALAATPMGEAAAIDLAAGEEQEIQAAIDGFVEYHLGRRS